MYRASLETLGRLRHADNTIRVPHSDLRDGDLNWREGYLFRVSNLRRAAGREDVVRFEGLALAGQSISGTGYDGGTYGAGQAEPATIVRREIAAALSFGAFGLLQEGGR